MSFPPLAGGDHSILSSEYCSGYTDLAGVWNTGFYCPQTGSTLAVYCCGTPIYKYCCTDKPQNGTGAGTVEDARILGGGVGGSSIPPMNGAINIDGGNGGGGDDGNDYSGATRMRPVDDNRDLNMNDLTSLNLSDVPIIFGVACGVAAVLILVILVGFYITSCCAHYNQNRKRRSSMPGIYRDAATTNTSTNSGLVNLYSPTNSAGGGGGGGVLAEGGGLDNTQTYIVHHQQHSYPPASPDSISTSGGDHYQMGGGSASLVTTPLDMEWSSGGGQYAQQNTGMGQSHHHHGSGGVTSTSTPQMLHQQHQQQSSQHPLHFLGGSVGGISNHIDTRIHYTVHQTQNRLAVALTGSMNRLSDRPSPCPTPSSSYHVNIPLTPPDGYSYPSRQSDYQSRGLSPPPQYSSSMMARSESPPYYPSYDSGSSSNTTDNQHQFNNYLSRTSTLPLSLSRKPPSGSNRPMLTSPGPYGSNMLGAMGTQPQPKSILRTSQNYRRVVTNETPPPIPAHMAHGAGLYNGPNYTGEGGPCMGGGVTYRNVDSRTNLSSQPLLILESKVDNATAGQDDGGEDNDEDDQGEGRQVGGGAIPIGSIRRASITTAINATPTAEEDEVEDERRDHFDIHDIDSDALSRLIEMDLDSKL